RLLGSDRLTTHPHFFLAAPSDRSGCHGRWSARWTARWTASRVKEAAMRLPCTPGGFEGRMFQLELLADALAYKDERLSPGFTRPLEVAIIPPPSTVVRVDASLASGHTQRDPVFLSPPIDDHLESTPPHGRIIRVQQCHLECGPGLHLDRPADRADVILLAEA